MPERKQKHTMWLREGDYAALRAMYPQIGAGPVIRRIVANYVDKLSQPLSSDEIADLQRSISDE